jgi:hypothetical protein
MPYNSYGITTTYDRLASQAATTVDEYVYRGMKCLETHFPAEERRHGTNLTPELQIQFLTAYIQACTVDFHTGASMKALGEIVESAVSTILSALENHWENERGTHDHL